MLLQPPWLPRLQIRWESNHNRMGIKESNRVKIEVERTSAHELEGPPPAFRTSCRRGASRWAPAQPGSSSSRGVGAAWRRHDGRRTAAVSAAGRMLGGPAAAPKSRGSEQLASGDGGGGLGLNPDLFPMALIWREKNLLFIPQLSWKSVFSPSILKSDKQAL